MPDFTKNAIKETFIQMLDEKPLSEITVKSIAAACGINRNTFYYHFRDIPELIDDVIQSEANIIIGKYATINSIVECFDAIIDFVTHRKRAIFHIYRSVNRDFFEFRLMEIGQRCIQQYVDQVFSNESLSEADKEVIVHYYKCVCFGFVIDWLNNGMKDEKAVAGFRKMLSIREATAQEILVLFKANKDDV